jgi:hypothetical protein
VNVTICRMEAESSTVNTVLAIFCLSQLKS